MPAASAWHADAVVMSWRGREIAYHEDGPRSFSIEAQEREDGVGAVIADHPAKTSPFGVTLVQRSFGAVDAIEIAHEALDARMRVAVERRPIDFGVVVPLGPLCDLATHEQELLARMSPHEAQIGAQICKLLPVVPRHLPDQRALSVDNLVVRKRQDEFFRECIDEAERQPIMMIGAMDRVAFHVLQR